MLFIFFLFNLLLHVLLFFASAVTSPGLKIEQRAILTFVPFRTLTAHKRGEKIPALLSRVNEGRMLMSLRTCCRGDLTLITSLFAKMTMVFLRQFGLLLKDTGQLYSQYIQGGSRCIKA